MLPFFKTIEMNAKYIEDWEEKKKNLKQQYPFLTEKDLEYSVGKEIELLRRLQKKLNKNEKEIRKWLSWMG